jgi:small multidrug resistance pump
LSIIFLLISGSCSAIASILLRIAGRTGEHSVMLAAMPPTLLRVAALGAYGVGFLLYAVALKRVELSIAYPVMVAVTVIELFLFSLWSGDVMSLKTASGAALLVAGVWLIYSSQAKLA